MFGLFHLFVFYVVVVVQREVRTELKLKLDESISHILVSFVITLFFLNS